MSEPREFWIREWKDSQPDGFLSGNITEEMAFDVFTENPDDGSVHVIEYSAYKKLKAENESLKESGKLADKVDRALEIQVIDWLQWNEFSNDKGDNLAQLTLTLLATHKKEKAQLRIMTESANTKCAKALEAIVKAKSCISRMAMTLYPIHVRELDGSTTMERPKSSAAYAMEFLKEATAALESEK